MSDRTPAAPHDRPSRDAFVDLGRRHAVVPVWREVLADLTTPLAVYDRIRAIAGSPAFLLESVEHGERWGRHSFIGAEPVVEVVARDGRVDVRGPAAAAVASDDVGSACRSGDPLAVLAVLLERLTVPTLEGLPPLFAGFVGHIGWEVVSVIEPTVPSTGRDDLGLDDVRLMLPGRVVAVDHLRQRMSIVTNVVTSGLDADALVERWEQAVAATQRLVDQLAAPTSARPVPPPAAPPVSGVRANMPRSQYVGAVERAKEHIRAGDAFQIVPSQRFALDTAVDPLTVYRVLRVINPSPYMYVLDWGDVQVVGSSPEALVTATGGEVSIWPIAGSRPRGDTDALDAAHEASLLADAKELAEHVMLVDLARNDLGRVCEIGSVHVDDFKSVVRYSHIMHLRSTVSGRLRPGIGPVDVIRATFPAGTLSGAPKVRAMQIIDDLEPTRRGIYGGGLGHVDLTGDLDLCIGIRTLVFRDGVAYVQAGAGVVADSVPDTEYAETQAKAHALLAAVRAAELLAAAP